MISNYEIKMTLSENDIIIILELCKAGFYKDKVEKWSGDFSCAVEENSSRVNW